MCNFKAQGTESKEYRDVQHDLMKTKAGKTWTADAGEEERER